MVIQAHACQTAAGLLVDGAAAHANTNPVLPPPGPAGAATPVFAFMFGRLLNAFFSDDLIAEVNRFALIILGIAGAALLSGGWGRHAARCGGVPAAELRRLG